MRTKRAFHVLASVGAVGLCVATAGASWQQGDTFRSPGHACHLYDAVGNDTVFDPAGFSANGIKNTSGSSQWAVCPIMKEDQKPGTPFAIAGDTMGATITISSNAADCRLYKRMPDGTNGGNWSSLAPVSVGNGRFKYDWTVGFGVALPTAGHQVSLYCNVPSQAVIEGYTHTVGWNLP